MTSTESGYRGLNGSDIAFIEVPRTHQRLRCPAVSRLFIGERESETERVSERVVATLVIKKERHDI